MFTVKGEGNGIGHPFDVIFDRGEFGPDDGAGCVNDFGDSDGSRSHAHQPKGGLERMGHVLSADQKVMVSVQVGKVTR